MSNTNIYFPYRMEIAKIIDEAPGVKTFRLKFKDEAEGQAFTFRAGQFAEYSAFGEGECTFALPLRRREKNISSVLSAGLVALRRGCRNLKRETRWAFVGRLAILSR